jgi:putative ABC transport system substrate-binding protein
VVKIDLSKQIKSKKQILVLTLLVVVCVFLSSCGEKKEEKVHRIGVLGTCGEYLGDILDAFKEKMTELGYNEGKNIFYDVYMAPNPVGNEQVVQKYVDEKVDVIFSFATESTIEAKKVAAGSGIPVVFTCAFIEGTGIVDSVRNPGSGITGVRYPTTESAAGRLEILHEIAPYVERVWAPYLKDYPTTSPQIKAIKPIALELGITLIEAPFATPQEVKDYLDEVAASDDIGMDAILMLAEPFSVTPEVTDVVYKFADEHKLPVSSFMVLKEAYGPIIGFHPPNTKMGRLAAIQADKVLKGTPAGTLPVFTADNDLSINYRLIQKLGLDVSEGLLGRADEIIR